MQSLWLRNHQLKAFEVLINIFANGLAINPDISKKINELTEEYLDLCLPGTKEVNKKNNEDFIAKSAQTLKEVANLLANNYQGNRLK